MGPGSRPTSVTHICGHFAALPYAQPAPEIYLNDFDKIEPENVDNRHDSQSRGEGKFKTRICSKWLEVRGFRTRLIERPFDSNFRLSHRSASSRTPIGALRVRLQPRPTGYSNGRLCARHGKRTRRHQGQTSTLISFHAFPNPRQVQELWPDLGRKEQDAQENILNGWRGRIRLIRCWEMTFAGRAELAGKSVAVPFVGASAATLVLAKRFDFYMMGRRTQT